MNAMDKTAFEFLELERRSVKVVSLCFSLAYVLLLSMFLMTLTSMMSNVV